MAEKEKSKKSTTIDTYTSIALDAKKRNSTIQEALALETLLTKVAEERGFIVHNARTTTFEEQ